MQIIVLIVSWVWDEQKRDSQGDYSKSEKKQVIYPKGPSAQLSYTLQDSNPHTYYPKPKYLIGSFGPLLGGSGDLVSSCFADL